jgi:hypothetical protein
MYPAVAEAMNKIDDELEGVVDHMYVDQKNLVTAGVGKLMDSPSEAAKFPWRHGVNGPLATQAEIFAAWNGVKNSGLAGVGGNDKRFAALNDLRLDAAAIDAVTRAWIQDAEPYLRMSFPRYDTMQADAQLAILLMAYALGPAFAPHYPQFAAAINALVPNYETAAEQSHISTVNNAGVAPRNADIELLLGNALRWQSTNIPADLLWWPGTSPPVGGAYATVAIPAAGVIATAGNLVGKITIGLIVFGFGWLGVSAYRAHQRGESWGAPVRRLAQRINTGEKRLEAKVDEAIKEGLSV